jgi:hypothetical protein
MGPSGPPAAIPVRDVDWLIRCVIVGATVALSSGCGPDDLPPPPPFDAGPRMDAGPRPDGGPRRDAGPRGIVVDGVLDDPEYLGAAEVAATSEPNDGSDLRRLVATFDEGRLVVGVELNLLSGDAVLVYLDVEPRRGVQTADLGEPAGELERRLAAPELTLPEGADLDFGWVSRVVPGSDDVGPGFLGWHALTEEGLPPVSVERGPSACTATACETALDLPLLGDFEAVSLFVRVLGPEDALLAETLPEGLGDDPARVEDRLRLVNPDFLPDAGPPDAGLDGGVDGGPAGIVVDGVLDDPAWAAAVDASNGIPVDGTPFAPGNALTRLRALREADRLVLAVEGRLLGPVGDPNAILVYVDGDFGSNDATGADLFSLADETAGIPAAISRFYFQEVDLLTVDAAWATFAFDIGPGAEQGWRDTRDGLAFTSLPTASSRCGPDACELAVALADLDLKPDGTIAVFVRLGDADSDALSNQGLPELAGDPETVSDVLLVP